MPSILILTLNATTIKSIHSLSRSFLSMADSESPVARTDGHGRSLIWEARSPDATWHIEIFGFNQYCNFLYAYARFNDGSAHQAWPWSFGLGREPVRAEQISIRWDLPNNSWGIFIDGECWAIYTHRAALRMKAQRIYSRCGPYARPYTEDEIRFVCAKRRGQRKGTRGFIIEE